MTRISAPAVAGCLCFVALASCQNGDVDAEAAYLGGDFIAAREYYNPETCAALTGAPQKLCNERAGEIAAALAGAAQYLGRRANDRIQHSRQIQFNRYNEAIRSLELALEIMSPEDPARPEFEAGVARIRETVGALEQELNEQLKKLQTMLETGTYDPDVWTDIRLTFERVRILLLAIGKADERPRALARDFVDKFRRHGQYEHARIATQLEDAVISAGRPARLYDDDELILFGVLDYLGQQQEQARMERIARLAQEASTALSESKPELAVDKAREVLALGAKGRAARRMRAILTRVEGASGQNERAREARLVVNEAPAAIEPVPIQLAPASSVTADVEPEPTSSSASSESRGPQAEGKQILPLSQLIQKYEAGDLYTALVGLESLSRVTTSSRDRRKIATLRRLWSPDRHRLAKEIVAEADRLFVQMDERCLDEYKRARRLRPDGPIREHIKERIDTLERILAQ